MEIIGSGTISEQAVALAAERGACKDAIDWLRGDPRTLDDLLDEHPAWFGWWMRKFSGASSRTVVYTPGMTRHRNCLVIAGHLLSEEDIRIDGSVLVTRNIHARNIDAHNIHACNIHAREVVTEVDND